MLYYYYRGDLVYGSPGQEHTYFLVKRIYIIIPMVQDVVADKYSLLDLTMAYCPQPEVPEGNKSSALDHSLSLMA